MKTNQLEQLKAYTRIAADTGDFELIAKFAPQDATTNPSLIYAATQLPAYTHLLDEVVADRKKSSLRSSAQISDILDHLLVKFGVEILKIIPGRVSTETDARLSFDPAGIITQAHRFIALYAAHGIDRERILIKVASTWEGIAAAESLEKEGIKCNLTLLFSKTQAIRCAEARVQLISPFVGRIYDWYKQTYHRDYAGPEDPGVQSVREIYEYYKKHGHETEVMGASFRNVGQILELAGCDLLTISPDLMAALSASKQPIERKLIPQLADATTPTEDPLAEKTFRHLLNQDAMASDRLAHGIRKFVDDSIKLETLISSRIAP